MEAVRARGGADEPATFASEPVSVPFTLTWRTCCGGGPGVAAVERSNSLREKGGLKWTKAVEGVEEYTRPNRSPTTRGIKRNAIT